MSGFGDEIIASGHALSEHRRTGKRVQILDKLGNVRQHDLWKGIPEIVLPGEIGDFAQITNCSGARPYIAYPWVKRRCRYSGWRVQDHVGQIILTDAERDFAKSYRIDQSILLEPTIAPKSNQNKQWGWHKWQALADHLKGHHLIQVGRPGTPQLDGVQLIETPTFRDAAAILARVRVSVLPEGGLHHAAGALGAPAVVLFGGTVDPRAMGYDMHTNIADSRPACGNWKPCRHCREVWSSISSARVHAAVVASLL